MVGWPESFVCRRPSNSARPAVGAVLRRLLPRNARHGASVLRSLRVSWGLQAGGVTDAPGKAAPALLFEPQGQVEGRAVLAPEAEGRAHARLTSARRSALGWWLEAAGQKERTQPFLCRGACPWQPWHARRRWVERCCGNGSHKPECPTRPRAPWQKGQGCARWKRWTRPASITMPRTRRKAEQAAPFLFD